MLWRELAWRKMLGKIFMEPVNNREMVFTENV